MVAVSVIMQKWEWGDIYRVIKEEEEEEDTDGKHACVLQLMMT